MKPALVAIFIALAGCAVVPPVGPAGHVILGGEHAIATPYWKPTEDDVRIFELQLARLLQARDSRVSGMDGVNLAEYGMKYYGTFDSGKRIIVGKGVHVSQTSLKNLLEENERPGVILLESFGGGSLFFTAVYDPATRKVLYVHANAAL